VTEDVVEVAGADCRRMPLPNASPERVHGLRNAEVTCFRSGTQGNAVRRLITLKVLPALTTFTHGASRPCVGWVVLVAEVRVVIRSMKPTRLHSAYCLLLRGSNPE